MNRRTAFLAALSSVPVVNPGFVVAQPSVSGMIQGLRKVMLEDPEYAWTWHCNLAMTAYDEGLEIQAVNRAAERFMRMLFEVSCQDHKTTIDHKK